MIDFLTKNYPALMKYSLRLCKNNQVAEDVLQTVAFKFIKSPPENVVNKAAFVKNTIKQVYNNYRAVNKKFSFENVDVAPDLLFDVDLIDSIALKEIKSKARLLPRRQCQEVMFAADGYQIMEGVTNASKRPEYMTAKTLKRLGILELKRILKENKNANQ